LDLAVGRIFGPGIFMSGYNFTSHVREALQRAREEAARLRHEYVGTEHILLGLLSTTDTSAVLILQDLGADLACIRTDVIARVPEGRASPGANPDLPYTSRAKKSLEEGMREAMERNHAYVGTEHLLLGLLRERKGVAAQVLEHNGIQLDAARARMLERLGSDFGDFATNVPSARNSDPPRETPVVDRRARLLAFIALMVAAVALALALRAG
jgi:ATP-dependent Clp protease ATP-binding subunit ClpC